MAERVQKALDRFMEVGDQKLEVIVCQEGAILVNTSGSQFGPRKAIPRNNSELEIDQLSEELKPNIR